jgi:hypothetical protein
MPWFRNLCSLRPASPAVPIVELGHHPIQDLRWDRSLLSSSSPHPFPLRWQHSCARVLVLAQQDAAPYYCFLFLLFPCGPVVMWPSVPSLACMHTQPIVVAQPSVSLPLRRAHPDWLATTTGQAACLQPTRFPGRQSDSARGAFSCFSNFELQNHFSHSSKIHSKANKTQKNIK